MRVGHAAPGRRWWGALLALFFVSGAVALAAEVVLQRLLLYVFGATHQATATVLAASMSGLSLGGFLGGRLSARLARPGLAYAAMEAALACTLAAIPWTFPALRDLGLALDLALAARPTLLAVLRYLFSFLFVLAPTLLMGGTLPMLLAAVPGRHVLQQRLPLLYAANALGGALGALVAGYAAIRFLGLAGTLLTCAGVSTLVAAGALALLRDPEAPAGSPLLSDRVEASAPAGPTVHALVILAFAQGLLAFALETVWIHLMRTVIGVTTYAFTVVLAIILLGIGAGSLAAARLLAHLSGAALFAVSQCVLAASVAASLFLWDRFPDVVAATLAWKAAWSFVEREAVRFLFAGCLLLPASLALGVGLPALAAAAGSSAGAAGRWTGHLLAANTVGAALGGAVTGLLLVGHVRSHGLLAAVSCLAGALGLAVLVRSGARSPLLALSAALCTAALTLVAVFPGWRIDRLTAASHYYWEPAPARARTVLYATEDAQSGFVTVEERGDGRRVLRTNGKYEADDTIFEFQDLYALVGPMYLPRQDQAVLIGLGAGRTLALLHELPFRCIEVAEFSPAVVEASRRLFARFTQAPLADAQRVRLAVADGRQHLQRRAPGQADYVAVGISGAAFAGVGALYNRDFFDLVRTRLTPSGVLLLWMQVHHVRGDDVRSVIYTLRQSFPHVHVYVIVPRADQAFLVASASPLAVAGTALADLARGPRGQAALHLLGLQAPSELATLALFTTDHELQAYFADPTLGEPPAVFSDDWPGFEYRAPLGLADGAGSFRGVAHAGPDLPRFDPPLDAARQGALRARRLRNLEHLRR